MRRITFLLFLVAIFATCFFQAACKKEEFYKRHWAFPLESQGSLSVEPDAASCGSCHSKQFGSWKATLHSRAVGPGFLWQLPRIGKHSSENCFNCHSPNPETKKLWLSRLGWEKEEISVWRSGVEQNGIQCVSCHFRNGKAYGPIPTRLGNQTSPIILENSNSPHGGFIARPEFGEAEFCKTCHQSSDTGRKINGKLLMDVYGQWNISTFGKNRIACQTCHMPNRNHEWKGISDPDMVRKGVAAFLSVQLGKNGAEIFAELKNTGVGHEFPTYSVPKVILEIWSESKRGEKQKLKESLVGWMLDLELQKEIFDTRIKPGGSEKLSLQISKAEFEKIEKIYFKVRVDPKEYYKRMFSDNWAARDTFPEETKSWVLPNLEKALREVESASYELYNLEWGPQTSSKN